MTRLPALAPTLLLALVGAALAAQLVATGPAPETRAPSAPDLRHSAARTVNETTFRIASLNVLGHAHTAAHGDKPRLASGPRRMRMQVRVLQDELVDVVGFQELEWQQHRAFLSLTAGDFDVWPHEPTTGRGVNKVIANAIAWRTSVWKLVETDTVTVPYKRGNPYEMPVLLLEHRVTGQRVYVTNVHNPVGRSARSVRWRAQGRAIQSAVVDALRTTTGLPVFWTGDFNDREVAFCDVRRRTDLVAATGGRYVRASGTCTPPDQLAIDWIFGSRGTAFTDVSFDRRRAIARSTDHRLVLATATVSRASTPVS